MLVTINQAILQFKQKQIDIRQRLSCLENHNRSSLRCQKDEKFEERINDLEGQFLQQANSIKEIQSSLGKLIKKVNKLQGDIEPKRKTNNESIKRAPDSKNSPRIKTLEPGSIIDFNGQLCSNNLNSTENIVRSNCSSAYNFSQKCEISASVDDKIPTTAFVDNQSSPPKVENDLCGIVKPISTNGQNPLDICNVKNETTKANHVYNNSQQYQVYSCQTQVPTNNIWFPSNIPANKKRSLNRMESDDHRLKHGLHTDYSSDTNNENVEKNPGVPLNTLEKGRGIKSTSCESNIHTKKILKNNFGLKNARTNLMFDNRVRLLTDQTCYEGIFIASVEGKTEEVSPLNIKPNHSEQSDSYEYESGDVFQDGAENLYGTGFERRATIEDWYKYAEQVTVAANIRVQSGAVERGWHGHDVTLVLDICEHMRGDKFESMKSAAKRYIEGVQQIKRTKGLEENVGIAVFGGQSRLLHEHTSDYGLLLTLIDELEPEGEAPLVGGLIMGMATVQAGTVARMADVLVQGHMIMFTDGTSPNDFPDKEQEVITTDSEVSGVIRTLAERSIRVYHVQLEEKNISVIMEQAVKETKGKVISIGEMYRLIRLTQTLGIAARVAGEMKFLGEEPNRDLISQKIYEVTKNPEDQSEDCIDFVVEFTNNELKEGTYKELKCRTLHLGDRVRRGPLWTYGNQDGNSPGTVIGQHDNGWVRVVWDNGHNNIYRYDESSNMFNLRRVNENRILVNEMIAVGCRVVRGEDWRYGDDDGGFGTIGTVLDVKPEGRAVVRWDSKKMGIYKMGYNAFFEIMVVTKDDDEQIPFTDLEGRSQNKGFTYSNSWNQAKYTDSNGEGMHTHVNVPVSSQEQEKASWEYKDKDSEWKKYPLDISYKIENAFKKKPTDKTIIKMDTKTYIINFAQKIQVNPQDDTKIKVRRSE
ncbi:uncharacterized protein LOC127734447 isoform X2 [Mytilus californianus]|uniref:uncharacterized protein LOC127734447 isoform X2 n=1 Tax=Mytilus californianus TaxID=6549 RepID=UPI002245A563|nr:uncharacterized protein LOC127734447 isoform X2 [Mytilus californianus]